MKYLLVRLLVGCATQQQRAERAIHIAEHEPDRVEKWGIYEYWCEGIMLWHNPVRNYRACRRRGCIPHRVDWDFYYKCRQKEVDALMRCENKLILSKRPIWKSKLGNNVRCVSRRIF